MTHRYIYCGDTDTTWELAAPDGTTVATTISSAALHHLATTETISAKQSIRKSGRTTWVTISSERAQIKKLAYGELLRQVFSRPELRWFFKGDANMSHGPFTGCQMMDWFEGGYFYEQIPVSCRTSTTQTLPDDNDFVTFEKFLFALTQPLTEESEFDKPLDDMRRIHCSPSSVMAFIGQSTTFHSRPVEIPDIERGDIEDEEPLNVEIEIAQKRASVQEQQAKVREAVLRCFYGNGQRFWFYIGQHSSTTIHGPYDGMRMYSWFEAGWLSLDVPVWSTTERITPINTKQFKCLKDIIAEKQCQTSIE